MIKAIALTAFVHGSLKLQRGDEADFSPPTFTALAAHGLVREATAEQAQPPAQRTQRAARAPANKKAAEPENKAGKAPDVGAQGAADPSASAESGAVADPATPPADHGPGDAAADA